MRQFLAVSSPWAANICAMLFLALRNSGSLRFAGSFLVCHICTLVQFILKMKNIA
jgi:hypothetical protein